MTGITIPSPTGPGPAAAAPVGAAELHRWRGLAPGRARRLLDIAVSLSALAVAGVPMLALMVLIRLDSRGPALFRQPRVGQGERVFTLLKLRTMRLDQGGPEITARRDPRVTRIGRLLRKTSLDELPQMVNVLRGDMTLVGPRPETPALAVAYPPACRWVFAYRPGLTGAAQVRLRDTDVLGLSGGSVEAYLRLVVPARSRVEARYLALPSLPATFAVLVDTVRYLFGLEVRRRG
ncbi:MAG TPA: sugar transferase [Micromonosporaceae bacterium]|nr:sugar transferase [Micromonosporaceae bacterium]